MSEISTDLIKEAVYKLCFEANTCLQNDVYSKILNADFAGRENILKNAKIAYEKKLPLCQDTGQVIVFVEIGQDVRLKGDYLEDAINEAAAKCYRENFFRKSVVKNSVFDRGNTEDNTPVIVYTDIISGDEIKLGVLVKGAGSENKSRLEMMLPTSSREEIVQKISELVLSAGENACPPMFVGIGIGKSADKAMVMSKKAFLTEEFSCDEQKLAMEIKDCINAGAGEKYNNSYVLDVKVLTAATHIACMPVGVSINCHSDRYSKCVIKEDRIEYLHKTPEFIDVEEIGGVKKEIASDDIEAIKALKAGDEFYLTGEIYIARDMAHKRMVECDSLPFDIKDKIILYAGPCPAKPDGTMGSIGPTTAGRMDKYAEVLYSKGLLATIGKGNRSEGFNHKYFTLQGGIAAMLAEKVTKSEIIAYEDLGTEAVYKISVDKFPLKVEIA